jgi:tight adherence protein C
MDKAGKAEISMMVPVVFLILPVSILFALWPSVIRLNLFAA